MLVLNERYKSGCLVFLFLVVPFILYRMIRNENVRDDIAENGVLCVGEIVEKVRPLTKNSWVKYRYVYFADGERYRGLTLYDYNGDEVYYEIGDSIWVLYDVNRHSRSFDYYFLKRKGYKIDEASRRKEMRDFPY